jgi:hypothetical protein
LSDGVIFAGKVNLSAFGGIFPHFSDHLRHGGVLPDGFFIGLGGVQ